MVPDAYRHIASVYDAVTRLFLYAPRRALLAACRQVGAKRILDAGCGTGVLAGLLLRQTGFVAGLDSSEAMLRQAARRFSFARAGAPAFIRGDASLPPFAPGSFDLVIFSLVLHESEAGADRLLEQAFFLAPRVLVLDWRLPERNLDYLGSFWVPGIERLAGKEHYARYRAFMRSGGVGGLAGRTGARLVYERPLALGSLVLALLEQNI